MERGVSEAGICYTANTVLSIGACSDQMGMTQSPFLRENSLLFAHEQNLMFFGSFATETCTRTANIFRHGSPYKKVLYLFRDFMIKFYICEFH